MPAPQPEKKLDPYLPRFVPGGAGRYVTFKFDTPLTFPKTGGIGYAVHATGTDVQDGDYMMVPDDQQHKLAIQSANTRKGLKVWMELTKDLKWIVDSQVQQPISKLTSSLPPPNPSTGLEDRVSRIEELLGHISALIDRRLK